MASSDTQVLLLGSSKWKLASFTNNKVNVVKQGPSTEASLSKVDLNKLQTLVISVRPEFEKLLSGFPNVYFFNKAEVIKKFKLHNIYPQMGADRLANLIGAITLHPQKPVAIIDLGTCTTLTILDWNANRAFHEYKGGFISVGVGSSFAAIKQFTSNLPNITELEFIEFCLNWKPQAIASSPFESICQGVIKQTIGLIKEAIHLASEENPQTQVILTGGWSVPVQSLIGKVAPKLRPGIEINLGLIGGNAHLQAA